MTNFDYVKCRPMNDVVLGDDGTVVGTMDGNDGTNLASSVGTMKNGATAGSMDEVEDSRNDRDCTNGASMLDKVVLGDDGTVGGTMDGSDCINLASSADSKNGATDGSMNRSEASCDNDDTDASMGVGVRVEGDGTISGTIDGNDCINLASSDDTKNGATAGSTDGSNDNISLPSDGTLTAEEHDALTNVSSNGGLVYASLLLKLRKMIKELKDKRLGVYVPIANGFEVVTRSDKIAKLTKNVVRYCCKRIPTYGNVIKESDYFPGWYLVHFYKDNEYYYCTEKVIKVVSNTPITHIFNRATPTSRVHMQNVGPKNTKDDELIMQHIFCSKLHQTPGHAQISVPEIIKTFQPMFPWLNESKVYRFLKKNRPTKPSTPSKKKRNRPNEATCLPRPTETPTARTIKKLKKYVTPLSLSKTTLGKRCSICKYYYKCTSLSIDIEDKSISRPNGCSYTLIQTF